MNRKIDVMGGENFKTKGMFFVCSSDEIQWQSRSDIVEWFGDAKKFKLENENEFEIMAISPMMTQFTNKAVFLVKVDTDKIPAGIYPTTAVVH